MAVTTEIEGFRRRLNKTSQISAKDPARLLAWRERRASEVRFESRLIPLDECRTWYRNEQGDIWHDSGQFFSIQGVRTEAGNEREVASWDQPIFNQREGGVLALLARETRTAGIEFLLAGKLEPGNIGKCQLAPTFQSTWSNIRRAHSGKSPPLADTIFSETAVRLIYSAAHNEEGGRFWRKSNENRIVELTDPDSFEEDARSFVWASLDQIKALALIDDVVSPYVKTIIAPL